MASEPVPAREGARMRDLVIGLLVLGEGGLLAELILLEHYESPWQWAPIVLLAIALVVSLAAWRRPAPRTLGLLRGMMLACVVCGLAGLILHLLGNRDWAIERDPELSGLALVWKVLRGATPALAPGALAQLGLLGLLFTHRHPALDRANHHDQEITH